MRITGTIYAAAALAAAGLSLAAFAAGDLTRQTPVDISVDLGSSDKEFGFFPNQLEFETGKLYRLVLRNGGREPHYFTSPGFATRVFTRKVVVAGADGKPLGEIKGAIGEIEVFPGGTSEWWFVPLQTGMLDDLVCGVRDADGKTHADKGMSGRITIR
jgi:uncharacterized cupredoxin-like copper-binding protein